MRCSPWTKSHAPSRPWCSAAGEGEMIELSRQTYRALAEIIRHEAGIVLGPDKSYLVRHRLDPLILSAGLQDYEELLTRLNRRDATALRNSVIDAITVKETRFFRDPAC